MGRVFLRVSLLVVLWSTGAISSSVFYSGPQANMVLRAKRANSFLEELKPPSKERECVEEICDFEEAREIFQTREATMEFWTVYRDGNQCEPNPCLNGVCVDEFQAYSCKCIPGFEGKLCNFNSTASNCSKDNGDCDHGCHESKDGLSRTCSCLSGYTLQENSRNCLNSVNFACGQVILMKPITVLRPFVVGGQIGKKGESPWQALILNKKGRLHCGGVLIAESWVLTSAHCLEEGSPYSVRLGDYERFKMEDTEVTLPVTQFISHPEYNTNTEDNDIAMLRLASPVQYTQYIVPVCLPSRDLAERMLLKNGTETIVTGWGKEKETSKHLSSALNFIKVPLVEHAECASAMVNNVTQNMLCAGRLGHQEDACKGDSGGPMVTKFRKTWFLIGLVSWGEGCGRMDKFGIYTKVSNYLEWIQSVQSTSKPT